MAGRAGAPGGRTPHLPPIARIATCVTLHVLRTSTRWSAGLCATVLHRISPTLWTGVRYVVGGFAVKSSTVTPATGTVSACCLRDLGHAYARGRQGTCWASEHCDVQLHVELPQLFSGSCCSLFFVTFVTSVRDLCQKNGAHDLYQIFVSLISKCDLPPPPPKKNCTWGMPKNKFCDSFHMRPKPKKKVCKTYAEKKCVNCAFFHMQTARSS